MSQNKSLLETEMQDHTKQIEKLTKRKAEMQAELNSITAGIETRMQVISAGMVDGRNVDKESSEQLHAKIKADEIRSAIAHADSQITEKRNAHDDNQRKIGYIEIDSATTEFEKHLLGALDVLHTAVKTWEALPALYDDYRAVAAKHGQNPDYMQATEQTVKMFQAVGSIYNGSGISGNGIKTLLDRVEEGYPNYLRDTRKKLRG